MTPGNFRFDRFVLDPPNRRLSRDGAAVEFNARYLDALALLVREQGNLVSKDHFLGEVWRGVPVTDEALTQCIKTLRRQLGDDAANPRFIETVPKHGYRFVAPVEFAQAEPGGAAHVALAMPQPSPWLSQLLLPGGAGSIGGAAAGLVGGLFYGFMAASQPVEQATGAASALVVIVCVTVAVALVGAAGVAFGIAGALIPVFGGTLMAGSLNLLAQSFPGSHLRLDAIGSLFGESQFGPVSQVVTGAIEAALFGIGIVGAMLFARRHFGPAD